MFNLFDDSNEAAIPHHPGLYAFFLDPISPGKIGLAGRGPWGADQLRKAKASMIDRCRKQIETLNKLDLNGIIREESKWEHVQVSFQVKAKRQQYFGLLSELERLDLSQVRSYAHLLHQSATISQPIYVGIAVTQTLRDRHKQHKCAFFSSTPDPVTFGGRLREACIDWDDVIFAAINLSGMDNVSSLLSLLERHLHAITHPPFSLR